MRWYNLILLSGALPPVVTAREYYFDGSAPTNGNGRPSSPYDSLEHLGTLKIGPGDDILLKRGTRFNQSLVLNASGSVDAPITIQAYGHTSQPLPVIAGRSTELSSVLLLGTSHVVMQDLEITNLGDNTTARRGVYVYAEDSGEVKDLILRRLYIHDVHGYMPSTTDGGLPVGKYSNASGGIVLEAAGNFTPTYFTDIIVEDNFIHSVAREGIYTWSNWCQREALAAFWHPLCTQPWYASRGLKVRRNHLQDIGGDGIVVTGNVDAVVSHNHLTNFNVHSGGYNAGIWTANSDGSLFQYNVVSGGKTTMDGMSYDVDHSTSGTIFEYNVSHDNEGGFFLMCPYDKPTRNFTIRYNLSVNDKTRLFQACSGDLVGGRIYKNTIAVGEGLSPIIVQAPANLSLDVLFANNIVRKSGSGSVTWDIPSSQFNVTSNIFYGAIGKYADATGTITEAPQLAAPGLRDPNAYLLLANSPALGSAIIVDADALKDFFSNPTTQSRNLGFYSGHATKLPQWISNFDDSNLSSWSTSEASVVADPAGDLGKSLKLEAQGTATRRCTFTTKVQFDARVWFSSTTGNRNPPSIKIGRNTVAFRNVSKFDVGFWRVLEILVTADGSAHATLDGEQVPVSLDSSSSSQRITISAGEHPIYVDDVFIVPT